MACLRGDVTHQSSSIAANVGSSIGGVAGIDCVDEGAQRHGALLERGEHRRCCLMLRSVGRAQRHLPHGSVLRELQLLELRDHRSVQRYAPAFEPWGVRPTGACRCPTRKSQSPSPQNV